ncbi:peptidoglycan DD-metalloendopeptidase family protein [Nonlabens ulvanivorans]|uniref:Peptidase M23 n=1 Tax=Nonlabens ulvanivorans TaxID=906888 RepID=A0A084JU88_NONUL|nr:peptidoglycan DD-metalloendopeptidase family protein [Nonlabens ulvanivorans]KEZ92522.1 peptidase M23 [Nonlabens ulvanivorans]PRX15360.1 peptidase M23-like protein [Nonlabens ulvanivorans]
MIIKRHLIDPSVGSKGYFHINLSVENSFWDKNDVSDIAVFEKYLAEKRDEHQSYVAHGGYLEQRALYRKNARFQSGITRDVHMGIDLWAPAGSSVHAVMDGVVHSFAHNDDAGNYGPTIILEHDWNGQKIYSLYGHLSISDMAGWEVGVRFRESEKIATLGTPQENGGYSPHLHFQVMTNMRDYRGDFPGVAAQEELASYENMILDPNPFIFTSI